MNYYPNESGYDCFKASLCNLLLQQQEFKLAKQVYENFNNHPLIKINQPELGIELGITPKLVRELTNNEYFAKVQLKKEPYDMAFGAFNTYPDKIGRKYSKVINQELSKQTIEFVNELNPQTPNYMLLKNFEKDKYLNHFVVQTDVDNLQIDDGCIEKPNKSDDLIAILQIYKK